MTRDTQLLTITALTRQIRSLLENAIPTVWVQGEISNCTHHTSGHLYFTLKDTQCQIKCVMWRERTTRLFFTPQDGMKVMAQGDVTVYERAGQYQLRVGQLQPVGIGDLQLAFERLKEKLYQEGLFDEDRKRPIPPYPRCVGVITSSVGAAIQDIVNISQRRFPGIRMILCPVRVQGDGAAQEIARAIDDVNRYGQVDVLIVTRGGGSLEDLWAFNEEIVARAIFNSSVPVVSAVGHEIDFTISDFVADLRAPTPSAAAELVIPDRRELLQDVQRLTLRSKERLEELIQRCEDRLRVLISSYGLRHPMDIVYQGEQRRDELIKDLTLRLTHFLGRKEHQAGLQHGKLEGLDPRAVLKRGYSICYRLPQRHVVREAGILHADDAIEIAFSKGMIRGIVHSVRKE
jgi:exodeoxyribonuclease VII large subunit